MAYNRENFLNRVKEVNELYLEKQRLGIPTSRILSEYIEPRYHISRSTLYEWLAIPYEKELRKLKEDSERIAEWEKRQQTIDFDKQD